ncbi:hypothetical protein DE146DRAFT_188730 [Phaeosphaeria sp. MPI-PUGE-AT-0046c]|nr:hypothetical protein DE146DRAFT_188730 [Phaeosphaeria sp. MPI-PUGE-AT-0046c]
MAAMMPSAFTAPDRRKKVVTYGKASRLVPPPNAISDNDAPSPERPRKKFTLPPASLKKIGNEDSAGSIKSRSTLREKTGSPDIFDVPSDDEFAALSATATKKPTTKRQVPGKDGSTSRTEQPELSAREPPHKPLVTSRKTEAPRLIASVAAKGSQKPVQQLKAPKLPMPNPGPATVSSVRRAKTPQATAAPKEDTAVEQVVQRSVAKPKATSQPERPTPATSKNQKPIKHSIALPSKRTIPKAATQQSRDLDVFDMPSSDDEAHLPTPKPVKKARTAVVEASARENKAPSTVHKNDQTESDDSTASRKRKRNGSTFSIAAKKPNFEQVSAQSLPQRSLKYQKQADNVSRGHNSLHTTASVPVEQPQQAPPAINKPRRTRVRTIPILSQPPAKAQSSPADLRNMLANRAPPQPPLSTESFEATAPEDETMYEISDSFATPLRPSAKSISGSITPRQKALFGNLLGTASATPSMPSISRLQLTDTKPKSMLAALSRSKSEMTPTASAKKTRLIASLKHAESSSDDEASGSESESGNEAMVESKFGQGHEDSKKVQTSTNAHIADDDMNIDVDVAADSQTSQTTTGYGNRQKFTYAKARSYLQEANPEDEFLMSMDMDEPNIFASQTKDSQTEDEEEMSQVRANHELKRHGQNTKFEWENLMLIDDIASKSSNAIRRSALLELTTKMADASFAHELLDSSLAQQFLDNLTSNGEIIFDFAAAVATVFMLQTNPNYTTLEQIHRSDHMTSLVRLLDNTTDIQKIAKNRKTNLSRIAVDAVVGFRSTTLSGCSWLSVKPETISPHMIATKALELMEVGLRASGSAESAIGQDALVKLVGIVHIVSEQCKARKDAMADQMLLKSIFSTLEAASLTTEKRLIWTGQMMQSLASSMSGAFQGGDTTTVTLAVKLCMNLTNNKPKACQQFSGAVFVRSLAQSIADRITFLQEGREEEQRTEALDTLILSLGAMINLTEHSDQARLNMDDGDVLLKTLAKAFVKGSARTTQAVSMEESQSSVVVGYLSVLIGNLCLNRSIRAKVRTQLPGNHLGILVDKIKEFVRVHEHANRKASRYEGDEGQQTWQNYTARILLVAEQLEKSES